MLTAQLRKTKRKKLFRPVLVHTDRSKVKIDNSVEKRVTAAAAK